MRIVVLAGGIGGSRFLLGVRAVAGGSAEPVTAIINTADDVTLHGLRICPDLDSVMYTLGAGIDPERGWGRAKETWTVRDELAAYGAEPTWFGLGDRDIATHLIRTRMLNAGYPLSAVTDALAERWRPGVRVLPMTDDRVETHVVVADDDNGTNRRAMHFQEWWIRHRAELPAEKFVPTGAEDAAPAPGVVEAIASADLVLIAPSNPVVSIGTILSVGGIRTALAQTSAPVVGISPIIGGAAVRGMAERCLPVVGAEVSAAGVARLYGARRGGGLLDGWLVDETDAGASAEGIEVRAVPLWMHDVDATAAMVRAAIKLAQEVRGA
ncbi:2-phospho-L-lactate transferase [Fodinicola acaciae]|uniref:2-phospho-L-lactate transferase n=1 Tax=Fodinicola acaciae TaxID=2681555 RepID=UPI0013D76421|nr:2-phospho-L-lactate transferase [Fodinicola acaciae]